MSHDLTCRWQALKQLWLHRPCELRQRVYFVDTVLWLVAERARDERCGQRALEAGRHDEGRCAGTWGEFTGCK